MYRTFLCLAAAISAVPALAGTSADGADLDTKIGIDLVYDIHITNANPESAQQEIVAYGEFSRTRITVKSELDKWLQTKVAVELKKDGKAPELKDAVAELKMSKYTNLIVGRQKVLGGMDQSLSKMEQYLLDRSLANNLFGLDRFDTLEMSWASKNRSGGNRNNPTGKKLFSRAMVFMDSEDSTKSLKGAAVKMAMSSSNEENSVESLFSINGNAARTLQPSAKYELEAPVFSAGVPGYKLNRPKSDWRGFQTLAIDGGVRANRWVFQCEGFRRRDENGDGHWYRSTGHYWLLSRSFNGVLRKSGSDAFEPDISRARGWELTVRYSDARITAPGFNGEAKVVTAGANVYLGKNSKVAVQYETGRTIEQDNSKTDSKDSTGALSVRLQYAY